MKTALIVTVKNEAKDITTFLTSILYQTLPPDLVVIVDGGSTDDTLVKLWKFVRTNPHQVVVLIDDGSNRSEGRNTAIKHAMLRGAQVIACTNVCQLSKKWFERVTEPIRNEDADVVKGVYILHTEESTERAMALVTQFTEEDVLSGKAPGSAVSMALSAEACRMLWTGNGPFREDLEVSEDTELFDRIERSPLMVTTAPKAIVTWKPGTLSVESAYRTFREHAIYDAKARVRTWQYLATYLGYAFVFLTTLGTEAMFLLAAVAYLVYLVYRLRRILPRGLVSLIIVPFGLGDILYCIYAVVVVDVARMVGYARGVFR